MKNDAIEQYLEARRKALGLPPVTGDPFLLKYGRTEAELRQMSNSRNIDTDNPLGGEAHVHTPDCNNQDTGFWSVLWPVLIFTSIAAVVLLLE
jgi:hypothetical protein